MRIDGRLLGFGLFLLTVGGVILAVRQGIVDEAVAKRAWTLWPLILVGVGLSVALARRPAAVVGGLLLAVTFGAMVGGVAATGAAGLPAFCSGDRGEGQRFSDQAGELAATARVRI